MAEYHKYVFDLEKCAFVGNFEGMYQQELVANFDSWHQEDSRQLNRKIALDMLEEVNFSTILDIGTGKGSLSHRLKKRNNHVLGVDVSPTAIAAAKARFPDIDFEVADANDVAVFEEYLIVRYGEAGVDLAFSAECLSYIENWRQLVAMLAAHARHLLITLYIPENPIGFVKSADDLETEVAKHFDVNEVVVIKKSRFIVLLASQRGHS